MLPLQPNVNRYFFFSEKWKYLDVTFVFELMLSFLIAFNFFFFFNFGAFLKSCEIQKSKMVDPIWPPLGNNGVFTASYDVITSRCRPQRKHPSTYCLSSRPDCRSFYSYKVMRRGKESPQYPPPKHNDRNVLVGIHFVRYRAT